jgi:hypothetical protein
MESSGPESPRASYPRFVVAAHTAKFRIAAASIDTPTTHRGFLLALLVIVTVAAGIRFHRLDSIPPGLFPDVAMNGDDAIEAIRNSGLRVFYPANYGREGLFINLQALAIQVTGRQDAWVLRSVSAVMGTLTVAAFAFLLLELGRASRIQSPESLALVGAALLATSFWHVVFSRLGLRAISAPLFLCISLALLSRALASRSFAAAVAGGVAFGLGFHTYIAYRFAPLLLLPFWPRVRSTRHGVRLAGAFLIAALCAVAPLAAYFVNHPTELSQRARDVSVFASSHPGQEILRNFVGTAGMFFVRGDRNWIYNVPGKPQLFFLTGLFMGIGLVVSVRRRSLLDLVVVSWLALGMIPTILTNPAPHSLRSLLAAPAALALAALGLVALLERAPRRFPKWSTAAVLLILPAMQGVDTWTTYFHRWGESPQAYYEMGGDLNVIARQIDALPLTAEKVVVVRSAGPSMNGVPWTALGVAYLTDSYTLESRAARHVRYMSGEEFASLGSQLIGSHVFVLDP